MSMKHAYLISFMLLSVAISLTIGFSPCPADEIRSQGIRLDGTFGATGKPDLPGPDFDIPAEYGKQIGSNLFHSFARFNLNEGETATFSGPASVQNIVSRVTGGEPSWINGNSLRNPRRESVFPESDGYRFRDGSGIGHNRVLLRGNGRLSPTGRIRPVLLGIC